MKSKKMGIIVVVLLVLICSIVIRYFLKNKSKKEVETIKPSGEVQESNTLDIDKQLATIVKHFEDWKSYNDEGNYAYAITDLDHNGRLEIISSNIEGSGWYSYTSIYEVNEKQDGLVKCVFQQEKEGESEADIITTNEWNMYYDKLNDTYHYILLDDLKINAMDYYQNKRDFVLKDGKITEQFLASKEITYDEMENEQIKCTNASGENISLEIYERIDVISLGQFEKKIQNIEWIMNTQMELKDVSQKKLLELLKESYNHFDFYQIVENKISNKEHWSDIDKERMTAYQKVLKDLYNDGILPDGMDAGFDIGTDKSEDKFAICDIDNDGEDELLIAHTSTAVAGMVELVYGYDENAKMLNEELSTFPFIQYYDNGVIVADWSHNQGKAGNHFWPYTLYQYNSLKDKYEQVGMVDAWDKSYTQEIYPEDEFPSEKDKDGNGMIYYIMSGDSFQYEDAVDDNVYQAWRNIYIQNARKVKVPYQNLTSDNIKKLDF